MRRRAAVAGLLLLAGCGDDGPSFGLPESASREGDRVRDLWQGFFVAGVAVVLLIWLLVGYVLVRYRRRNDDVPRQNPYNIPIEVLYTVVPVLVVAGLFAVSTAVQERNDDTGPADVRVEVVGFQWQWRFTYPDEGISLVGTPESGPPELVLPVDEVVQFDLVAEDVVHSFWVPNFLDKRDLIPGHDNRLDLTPTRVGTYPGRCAEFCGIDHWRMGFTVRVVAQDEYEAWVAEHGGA